MMVATGPTYHDVNHWIVAFQSAARAQLRKHGRAKSSSGFHLKAEPCSKHGPPCVWVMYGCMVDHFPWKENDPTDLAEMLLRGMAP